MEHNGRHKSMSQEKDNDDDDDDDEKEEEDEEGMEQWEDEVDDVKGGDDRVEREEDKGFGKEDDEERRTKRDTTSSLNKKHYKCEYAVENSSRFSLRVIEAMRSLQRHENVLPISSVNEIVDYISNNYNNDGDLYTQVRTALKQLLKEGFVVEVLNEEYQLIGPFPIEVILEDCDCRTDGTKTYFDTPKYYKSGRALSRNKRKNKSRRCFCEESNENERELDGNDGKDRNKDVSFSLGRNYYDSSSILRTPSKRRRSLRSRTREDDDNYRKYTEIGRTTVKGNETKPKGSISYEDRCERSVRNCHDDTDDIESSVPFPSLPSKRTRRRDNDDVIKKSSDVWSNRDINNASNDDHRSSNDRSRDSVFQELKGSLPVTSKSHEMELKKWIQRCRRECEKQNKR